MTITENCRANDSSYWVYFGTARGVTEAMKEANVPESQGIYVGLFHNDDGSVSDLRLAASMESSGFLVIDSQRHHLFVVGSQDNSAGPGVYSYKIDPKTGDLTLINRQDVGGAGPCHLDLSPDGRFLAVANYSSGDFAIFPVTEEGEIAPCSAMIKKPGRGPNARRQDSPKGHAAYFLEDNNILRVLLVDLGSDRVIIGVIDPHTGAFTDDPSIPELVLPPGSGPRHLAWAKKNAGTHVVFVLNELDSTLSIFNLDFRPNAQTPLTSYGAWSTIPEELRKGLTDEVTLVDGKEFLYGNKTSEIEFCQWGETSIIYASNRGHNSIAVFDVNSFMTDDSNPAPGRIQLAPTFGTFPRYFFTDPSGRFMIVCNKRTGTIYTFEIEHSGTLSIVQREPIKIGFAITGGFHPRSK